MDVVFTHGAGLDVHQQTVMACRLTPDPIGQQAEGILEVRACGPHDARLAGLVRWVDRGGDPPCRHGEYRRVLATGRYPTGRYLYRVPGQHRAGEERAGAEDGPGRRALASQTAAGWLQARLIPPVEQRDRRDLTRYRTQLVQERPREINRVQGGLERATIKLASVATDVMGVSGRAILAALIAGRTDPATMAALAKGRLRAKLPVLEQALTGLVRDHHRRLLAMQVAPRTLINCVGRGP